MELANWLFLGLENQFSLFFFFSHLSSNSRNQNGLKVLTLSHIWMMGPSSWSQVFRAREDDMADTMLPAFQLGK
jgi:hypothetical protein